MSVVRHPYFQQLLVEKQIKGVKKRGQSSLAFGNCWKDLTHFRAEMVKKLKGEGK